MLLCVNKDWFVLFESILHFVDFSTIIYAYLKVKSTLLGYRNVTLLVVTKPSASHVVGPKSMYCSLRHRWRLPLETWGFPSQSSWQQWKAGMLLVRVVDSSSCRRINSRYRSSSDHWCIRFILVVAMSIYNTLTELIDGWPYTYE